MKLLKIIVAVFIIYFIRRLFQMYQAMKQFQASQEALQRKNEQEAKKSAQVNVIQADFKVID